MHYDEDSSGHDQDGDDLDDNNKKYRRSSNGPPSSSSSASSSLHTHGITNLLRRVAAEVDRFLVLVENISGPARTSLYVMILLAVFVTARVLKTGSFHAAVHFEKKRLQAGGGWNTPMTSASSKAALAAVRGLSGKNVISYSLYGSDPRYADGILENARLAGEIYGPEWTMRVYHDKTVPKEVLGRLKDEYGVELVDLSKHDKKRRRSWPWGGPEPNKMVWRFGAASDPRINRYCIRDGDSRLSKREKAAVDEWVDSGLKFHVMKDHPSHGRYYINGGMWCGTRDAFPNMVAKLKERENDGLVSAEYLGDMNFLTAIVWPVAKKSVLIHDSFTCTDDADAKPFPTPREGWEHVGSVYVNGRMREGDVKLLRDAIQPEACKDRDPHHEAKANERPNMGGDEDGDGERESTTSGSWWDRLFGGKADSDNAKGGGGPKDGDVDDSEIQQQTEEGLMETDSSKFCFKRAPTSKKMGKEQKGQITADTTFGAALRELASKSDVRRVLEIGTWYGGGSTDNFVAGLKDSSNCDVREKMQCCEKFVITFELSKDPEWKHARVYHRDDPVWLVRGTTVGVDGMLTDEQIPEEEKGEHYKLYYQRDRDLMANEEPQLEKYCDMVHPDVVLIDGNEYTGRADFDIAMKKCKPRYLALHDTGTLKTRGIEEEVQKFPDKFREVNTGTDKSGWAIYKLNYNEKPQEGSFRIILLTSTNHFSLQKLLTSLNAAQYDAATAPLHLEIRIDETGYDSTQQRDKTVDVAEAFNFDHGTMSIHKYTSVQGRQNMWFKAWDPQRDDERAVILEDELEVSPLWFSWLENSWSEYGERQDLGAISLCRQGLRASDGQVVEKDVSGPFLYRVPGSHGFSPLAKQWREFIAWAQSTEDLKNADVDVAGTITTQWHRDGLDTWEQYWVWWCWGSGLISGSRSLYNLYIHPPGNLALVRHATDTLTQLVQPSSFEGEFSEYPKKLVRFGWNYQSEGTSDGSTWLGGLGGNETNYNATAFKMGTTT